MSTEQPSFSFGKNWQEFVEKHFSAERVAISKKHLLDFLKLKDLDGRAFLDVGCGSGLHSLAAQQAGASPVVSFDADLHSVQTTRKLKESCGNPASWTVLQGSILDPNFLGSLEPADIVYAWGVLHHTGDMWKAVANTASLMKPDGVMFIALYAYENYQNPSPEFWLAVKRRYNRASALGKRYLELWYACKYVFLRKERGRRNPLRVISEYKRSRGMDLYTDVKDWLGGWPMEFAKASDVIRFADEKLGLTLLNVKTGEGNTEYLFKKRGATSYWDEITKNRERLTGPFIREDGHCWVASIPNYAAHADNLENPTRSPLAFYENESPLPWAHSSLELIRGEGLGRYSHRGSELRFSTSDNSDPNQNGRTYSVVAEKD